MTKCAIKVCRNYKGRTKTTDEVTYHGIPKDLVIKNRWVDIIRRSRQEDLWKPAKTTVICSDHFREKDMYFVTNKKRRRLKKEAVPSKALFISSCKSDESENSDEIEMKRQRGLSSKASISAEEQSFEDENSTTTATQTMDKASKKSTESVEKSSTASVSKDVKKTLAVQNCVCVEDYSYLDSIFDSPKQATLREKLHKKTILQKKHILKIQSLRRKNIRLKKKIASMRQILQTLKTERYLRNDIHDVLCSNVFAADLYASMKKKLQGQSKKPTLQYAPELRKFCLTLYSLSPNAYSYVRRKFDMCLPHPKTIAKWHSTINGSPGSTEEAFNNLGG